MKFKPLVIGKRYWLDDQTKQCYGEYKGQDCGSSVFTNIENNTRYNARENGDIAFSYTKPNEYNFPPYNP